ncbi:MAG: transporter substrate-binding domain-containing protein [Desulfobulbaceae bacterium]|uniref:Transporter substrate-binding domain-containing protein n=1 Tax=Candidatus Desulfatifera sulfidica TaxID=2841691 RepID=A0A8J6TCQ7_9BACT|nr:transporter substrate-binding domain-containing protein [Candidatus Desulfatifera sulfidica]
MKVFTTLCLTLVLSLGSIGAAWAGKVQQQLLQESMVEQVIRRGVLRVGMDTFLPWAMKDKTGEFVGFEIDVARRLAEDMGVKVEFVPTKWAGIIPSLLTGKFDVIIGGMGIRPQRALKVNFTIPYDYSGMDLVAHTERAAGFTTLGDFNRPDVEIACKLGTTAVTAAKKHMPLATLRLFDDEPQAFQELRNGRVHAVIASAPRPAYEALKYPETMFRPLSSTFTKEPIGFALRKGDSDSLSFFNSWITVVEKEGWLAERHQYWFGTRDWEYLVE